MKSEYYITQDGQLVRKENTIYFTNENTRRAIPVEKIYTIYSYGRLTITSGVISYLSKYHIPIHFFGYYGNYEGTFYPRETLVSGDVTVLQSKFYLDSEKRMFLAKEFIKGACKNILRNLTYYSKENIEIDKYIKKIEKEFQNIEDVDTIPRLMAIEGRIRDTYYDAFDKIVPEDFELGNRVRRPPNNKGNSLVSFGNSLIYATVLSEIYNTQLNPIISYLHEPFVRRFSLSLDVSEIFKPIIADRVIFKLINKGMLKDSDFVGDLGNMLLSDAGRRKFLEQYNERLNRTIKHKGLKRNVSYKRLIRLELYKLEKHILGGKKYKALVMWW